MCVWVMSCVHWAGWAILNFKNFNVGHFSAIFVVVMSAMFTDTIYFLPFDTTFSDLGLSLGSQGLQKTEPIGFSTQDEIWYGVEVFQVEHLDTTFEWDKGNNYFTDRIKNFSVGIHSDIYESIWFKLGLMTDTVELYILILVLLTLTLIQGHRSARKQKLWRQLSHKVFLGGRVGWFGWNLVYCWDLLV